MTFFLRHLELFLSAAGLAVIFLVPFLLSIDGWTAWEVAAVTAAVVGVLHGLIFWSVRHRQRLVRNQAIEEIKGMLKDVINNQLAVIKINLTMGTEARSADELRRSVEQNIEAVDHVSETLKSISEESLFRWKQTYGKPFDGGK